MSYRGYEAVIGLEIHAQLSTKSKIFSSDSTHFDSSDNENVSVVSAGFPGSLPSLNAEALNLGIKAGIALGCKINLKNIFARKNYFYPDLPKGYQISQLDLPLCIDGQVKFKLDGKENTVRIERAHMEEDAGKSTHFGDYTLINYNRAGVPLLEIVSAPDMRSPQEAAHYAKMVRNILKFVEVCDGNLEEGSLRCDCNVSVRKIGETKLGTKVELKNINSFRFIEKAIEYEIDRQIDDIESGKKIIQETRLYDSDKNRTYSMRTKEDAQDYRYFPDPDILPIVIESAFVEKIKTRMPRLPFELQKKYQSEHLLPEQDCEILTSEKEISDFFEKTITISNNPKATANWIMTEVIRQVNEDKIDFKNIPIAPSQLGQLIQKIDQNIISGKIAKTVFQEMWSTQKDPDIIIKEKNLVQITDTSHIEKVIAEIISQNESQVQEYRDGKTKVLGFFVGLVMKATKGQASPDLVNKILLEKLKG